MLNYLRPFIAFRTIAGREDEKHQCLDWILETFLSKNDKRLTMKRGKVQRAPWLYLQHLNPRLLWFAHVDVIPAKEEQFELRKEGDKIVGRGAKDMKGASLPFLIAYREMVEEGTIPPVSILLTSDEETAGPSIPTLLKEDLLKAPVAFTPDTGSNPDIVIEHKGVLWANLKAEGKGCHGALPWEGENPIPLLAEALRSIAKAFPCGSQDDWKLTVTPTRLSGSDAHNKVPDEAVCGLDIRYPPEDFSSPEEVLEEVRTTLPKGCTLELVLTTPPLQTDGNHPMVQRMKMISEEVLGKPVKLGREHGASDARYFSAAGIPSFLNGPVGGGIHGKDEWVSMKSLLQHYEINRRLLHELTS